jgi:hypothetical protein
MEILEMDRQTLWGELAQITPVEPLLLSAYEKEEYKTWKNNSGNSPHGMPWATSFHSSAFPGDDDTVCGRAQVYELLDPAPEKPLEPWLREWFSLGSALEHRWIEKFFRYGVLLSADVTGEDQFQTAFEDPDVWLTGSPDAIILPPYWSKSTVVEIKTTEHSKVLAMIADSDDVPNSHKKYIRQLKTYIGFAHEKPFSPTVLVCEKSGTMFKKVQGKWTDKCNHNHEGFCQPKLLKVEPPDDGTLIYSSREEPLKTVSYYCRYDKNFLEDGKEKLKVWRQLYLEGKIPPHVRENEKAKWSEGECRFCKWKPIGCKVDFKEKRKFLSESELINHTKKIRPQYDYNVTRKAVLDRWGVSE